MNGPIKGIPTAKQVRAEGYGYTRLHPGDFVYLRNFRFHFERGVHYAEAFINLRKTRSQKDVSCGVHVFVGKHKKMHTTFRAMRKARMGVAWIHVTKKLEGPDTYYYEEEEEEEEDDEQYDYYEEEEEQYDYYNDDEEEEENSESSEEEEEDSESSEEEEEDSESSEEEDEEEVEDYEGQVNMEVSVNQHRPTREKGYITLTLIKITDMKNVKKSVVISKFE